MATGTCQAVQQSNNTKCTRPGPLCQVVGVASCTVASSCQGLMVAESSPQVLSQERVPFWTDNLLVIHTRASSMLEVVV